jgi:hypothetical protein
MPCNHIKRRVILQAAEEFPSQLIHDFPRFLLYFILGYGMKEVSSIGKTISSQRAQLRQFKVHSPDLKDVATRWAARNFYAKALSALNDSNLTRLDE